MTDPIPPWRGDFAAAEDEMLRAGMNATPDQLLDWLEDAVRFAYETGALPRPSETER